MPVKKGRRLVVRVPHALSQYIGYVARQRGVGVVDICEEIAQKAVETRRRRGPDIPQIVILPTSISEETKRSLSALAEEDNSTMSAFWRDAAIEWMLLNVQAEESGEEP